MNTLVLGAGKMVRAILKGLQGVEDLSNFKIFSPGGESSLKLSQEVGAHYLRDLEEIGEEDTFDFILVGCKPFHLENLSQRLKGRWRESVFVSLVAAVSEKDQRKILGVQKLIRVMPNLPVEFCEGVTLLSTQSASLDLELVKRIFSRLGSSFVVEEDEFEELTLLTGCGPALFYEFSRYLISGLESLSSKEKEELVKKVFIGSATLLKHSEGELEKKILDVATKGGVTSAILEAWRSQHLKNFVASGMKAGRERSKEIRESLQR